MEGDGFHNGPTRPNLHRIFLRLHNHERGEEANELFDWLNNTGNQIRPRRLNFDRLLPVIREDVNEADDEGGEEEDEAENEEIINEEIPEIVEVIDDIQGFSDDDVDVGVNDDGVNEAGVSGACEVEGSLKRPREEDESVESSTDVSSESDPGFHSFKKRRKTRHQAEEEELLPSTSRKRPREEDESETDNSSNEKSGKRSRRSSEENQEEEPQPGPSRKRQRDDDAEDDNPGGKKKKKRNHLE